MKNLTPHTVKVIDSIGNEWVFPSEGNARVSMVSVPQQPHKTTGVPLIEVTYGAAELPECVSPGDDVIVSTMFADAYISQHPVRNVKLYVPDSGPSAIRENGQVKAVRALIRKG